MTTYTTRAAAGAAYAAAAQAYHDQLIELIAWDRATNAGRTFGDIHQVTPHAEFLQTPPGNTHTAAHQRHLAIEAAGGLVKESRGGPGASIPLTVAQMSASMAGP